MNFLDLASYLPKLGRMTAGLNDSYTGSSHFGSDSLASGTIKVRKKNRKVQKGEAIMMVKKPLVVTHSSACKSSTWSNLPPMPSIKKTRATVIANAKKETTKKKTKVAKKARPPNTELLLKQAKQIAGDTKNLHLLQEAIVEFKTQRDQFVQSLNGLQKKLKEFQIPELFAQSTSKIGKSEKEHRQGSAKSKTRRKKEALTEKTDDQGDKKVRKKKEVRSVSQHFYLADLTESEDTSTASSSSESSSSEEEKAEEEQKKLAAKKVKDFLDFNLIPIQPPEKRRNLDRVNSLMKHNAPWSSKKTKSSTVDGQLNMLKKTLKEVSNKKIPAKAEASRQRSSARQTDWDTEFPPSVVQDEFDKLREATEHRIQEILRST